MARSNKRLPIGQSVRSLNRCRAVSDIRMVSTDVIPFVAVLAFGVLAMVLDATAGRRGEQRLREWAVEHRYVLQDVVPASRGGGFGYWNGRGTRFFRILVLDREGMTRRGWVRIRPGVTGLGGKIEVRWQ